MKPDKKKPKEPKPPKAEPKKPGDQYAYPAKDDIYSNENEAEDIDPDTGETKAANLPDDEMNEKDFRQDKSGDDLDVPGVESDDDDEHPGDEDEENDYYSLGGDDHDDLEEDKGE